MTQPLCATGCDRPVSGAYLCTGSDTSCTAKLRRDLEDIATGQLLDDLEASYLRQSRFSTGRGSRSAETSLPWDERASSKTSDAVHAAVLRWARIILEQAPDTAPLRAYLAQCTADVTAAHRASRHGQARAAQAAANRHALVTPSSTPAAAQLLLDRLDWLRTQPFAGDAFRELHKTVSRVVHVVDRPVEASFAGLCPAGYDPNDNDSVACATQLYGPQGAAQVECPECKTLWRRDQLVPYFEAIARDWLATATEISRALPAFGVELRATPGRIRKWKQRGRLVVRGRAVVGERTLPDGSTEPIEHPTYRVGDVQELLREDAAAQTRREAKKDEAKEAV